jgi:hypothetical protein
MIISSIGIYNVNAAGVSTGPTITKTTPQSLTQQFGIGSGNYSSNVNYFINANGQRIYGYSTTYTLTSSMNGYTAQYIGFNFSFQDNNYIANGYTPALIQAVIQVADAFPSQTAVIGFIGYVVQENDGILFFRAQAPTIDDVPTSDFVSGMQLTISVNTNSTGNIISMGGQIKSASGQIVFSALQSITQWNSTTGGNEPGLGNLQVPVMGFESVLVGLGSGTYATFKQASGTITYSSTQTQLLVSPSPVGVSYVQYNQPDSGTTEHSNIVYQQIQNQVMTTTTISSSTIKSSSSSISSTISQTSIGATALQSITGIVINKYNPDVSPKNFGEDLGQVTWQTNPTGFKFNTSSTFSETIGLPLLSAIQTTNSLVYYNSTVTQYQLSGIDISFIPAKYDTIIKIVGSIPLSEQFCLPLITTGTQIVYNTTIDSNQTNANGLIFDWSDIPKLYSPTYNTLLNELCMTLPTHFNIDPLAIDGQSSCNTSSCSATLTTSNSPDVIIAIQGGDGSCGTAPTATGLTFSLRATESGGDGDCTQEWYAIASTTLSSLSISCHEGASAGGCYYFGISGANTVSPFDSHSGLPCESHSTTSSSPSCIISTSNANDFLIGGASDGNGESWTAGTGFSLVTGTCASISRVCAEYQIVSTTQTSLAVTFTLGTPNNFWDMVADAIVQASGGTTYTFTDSITISATETESVGLNVYNSYGSPQYDSYNATDLASASTSMIEITTNHSPEILLVNIIEQTSCTSNPVISVTTTGLTWHLRGSETSSCVSGGTIQESVYYSRPNSTLTKSQLTVVITTAADLTLIISSYYNINQLNPFDGSPCTAAGTVSLIATCNQSSSYSNDMFIGNSGFVFGCTQASGFILVVNWGQGCTEYMQAQTTLTNQPISFSLLMANTQWTIIGDTIRGSGLTVQETNSVGLALTQTKSISVSGLVNIALGPLDQIGIDISGLLFPCISFQGCGSSTVTTTTTTTVTSGGSTEILYQSGDASYISSSQLSIFALVIVLCICVLGFLLFYTR